MAAAASRAQARSNMGSPLFLAWCIGTRTDPLDAQRMNRRSHWRRVAEYRKRASESGNRREAREVAKLLARPAQVHGELREGKSQPARVNAR
jgi:hypothetical protein